MSGREDFSGGRIAAVYDASRHRLLDLLATLSDAQLDAPCPATPGWRVRDVVGHLTGIGDDALAGRLSGPPSPDITDRQVRTRHQTSLEAVLAEWETLAPRLLRAARAGLAPPELTMDMVSHEQDVRGAVGAPPLCRDDPEQADAIRFVAAGFAIGASRKFRAAGLPRIGFRAADTGWPGDDRLRGAAVVTAPSELDLARALGGRRSTAQVGRWDWPVDPAPYLPLLSPFGPLRDTDLVE